MPREEVAASDRRAWLSRVIRAAAVGALAVFAGKQAVRYANSPCTDAAICRGCRRLPDCGKPIAVMTRCELERKGVSS